MSQLDVYPYFASPKLNGVLVKVQGATAFNVQLPPYEYPCTDIVQKLIGLDINNGFKGVFSNGKFYVFEDTLIEGNFPIRLKSVTERLIKRNPPSGKSINVSFYRKQYAPTPLDEWGPRDGNVCILEHRLINSERAFKEYCKAARQQGYTSIFIKFINSRVDSQPVEFSLQV